MSKKQGNGRVIRPCHVCGDLVNYVQWQAESETRHKPIWHWANPDGSHHIHTIRKLKPCPFCGCDKIMDGVTSYGNFYIECPDCACTLADEETLEIAIERWNKRFS